MRDVSVVSSGERWREEVRRGESRVKVTSRLRQDSIGVKSYNYIRAK